MRPLAVALGFVSAVALVVSLVPIPEASSSFDLNLPSGWSVLSDSSTRRLGLDYCDGYAPAPGTLPPGGGVSPAGPTVCVTVYTYQTGTSTSGAAQSCYRILDSGGRPDNALYDWALQDTPATPPIKGAYEEVLVSDGGDRVYGLGLERERDLGATHESLCYLVTLTVP